MKPARSTTDPEAVRAAAARWTVRRDRGLSAAESIEFELWLAADPSHPAAMQRAAGTWSLLDRLPDDVAQPHLTAAAARRRARWRFMKFGALAAAAAIVVASVWRWDRAEPRANVPTTLTASGLRAVTLADGSLVRLNEGSEIVEDFTPTERRVRLSRGEAHFTVAKNPAQPFIVTAGTLRVRAVGTAFNVNFQAAQIEVLVTEGKVQLATHASSVATAPVVEAGHRAVLASESRTDSPAAPAIVVTVVDAAEMARALAWHDDLLRLGGATLAEIAAEFERRTGRRVQLADPALAQLRVGGRFRADDVDGFTNLLATTFDIEVDRAVDGTLVLRQKNPVSR